MEQHPNDRQVVEAWVALTYTGEALAVHISCLN
jgi:hypothetical protein